ncbi:long-chain fatty acid--CoA ligase [Pseudonocardia eucalypti]|uniref:Long-chain fatty acid--CoA ligase n=1 Tax=Pseudonocardia eucalypti TaxID=648755 RepID=A0ABP9R2U8_9PSEU|nr:fatty-acyl-CoA synthase [Pseudonocardia eucalypti]
MSGGHNPPTDLGSWMARRAASSPERPALTFGGETDSYAQLLDKIDRLAAELRAGGVSAGDRVGYLGLNHPLFLHTMFAAARLGAIFVPLNFRLSAAELAFIVGDAEIHTLIADADRARVIDPVRGETPLRRVITHTDDVPGWEALDALLTSREPLAEADAVGAGTEDVAVIMYTSGTTGRPKGAMLTHGNLFWNNVNALLSFDILSDDTTLVCAPLFHIGGLNVTTLLTLQKGGRVVLMPGFDPGAALALIAEHRVTTMFGVPAMFLFMSQHPSFGEADLSSVRLLMCGGAPVPERLMKLYNGLGVPFAQGYGLTETAPLALVTRPEETVRKTGSAGRTTTMLSDVRLLAPDGTPVPVGERGEICVRGPQVMAGYWRNPSATDNVIDADGWFHTGDVGVCDPDGYVYVVDRVKDMVISGGENVYPAEVESVLYDHPSVAEVAIIGTPDTRWGEAVTAVVVLASGASLTLDELREFARERLAGYKLPLRLEIVDVLPRNPAGKVLKYELRERFAPE